MALNIKDPETNALARELASLTGESLTEAIRRSLQNRLDQENSRRPSAALPLRQELEAIRRRCSRLPVLDPRTAEEILGHDDSGIPQ